MNGRLHEQISYSRNERHGVSVKLYSNGQLLQRVSYAKGFEYGESVVFHKNGKLRGVAFSDNHGRPHGQIVEYDESGNLEQIKFYVHGNKVDQAQYAKAVTSDVSLPPLASDPMLYKDRVMTANLKQMIDELRNQQPVKIPLEVDARTSSDSP
ncbi:MAG: hypothetical protein WC058_15255 [Phycisphaeraceae bacterium]